MISRFFSVSLTDITIKEKNLIAAYENFLDTIP